MNLKSGEKCMNLHDLELTDEYSNYFMTAFISVFNRMTDGEKFSKRSFLNALRRAADDNIGYFPHDFMNELIDESEFLINTEDDNDIRPERSSIPVLFTAVEKVYLKSILNSRYAGIFLDGGIIDGLMEYLRDVPDIDFDDIFQFAGVTGRRDISEYEIKNIRTILAAIAEKKELKYSNKARNGYVYSDMSCYPVRLEYSLIQDEFSVSVWSASESRPVKLIVSTMYDVSVGDNSWNKDLSPQEMMQKHLDQEPLIVEVSDEKNAIERFIYSFSMYDKRSELIDDKKLRIILYYYDFDQFEIANNLLSFGTSVKVVSPPKMIEKLTERIKIGYI